MSLDCTKPSAFICLGNAQGQVGCGDDFNKVHEIERALARLLSRTVQRVVLMAYGAGELGAETQ